MDQYGGWSRHPRGEAMTLDETKHLVQWVQERVNYSEDAFKYHVWSLTEAFPEAPWDEAVEKLARFATTDEQAKVLWEIHARLEQSPR